MTLLPAPALRRVAATRYVLPLREGGSLPGLMEADDLGTYVVKFTAAGQGRKALVAEVIVAELARVLGFKVPDLVLIDVDARFGRAEPDPDIQELLVGSAGVNLGIDYLPGALGFDPIVDPVPAATAAAVLWFDALVLNVDRSWRNPNLLCWHRQMWLIDHGAALYFAHNWPRRAGAARRVYDQADEHVLLARASSVLDAADALAPRLTDEVLAAATARVPDEWLEDEPGFASADAVRAAYVEVLSDRLLHAHAWLPALERARAAV